MFERGPFLADAGPTASIAYRFEWLADTLWPPDVPGISDGKARQGLGQSQDGVQSVFLLSPCTASLPSTTAKPRRGVPCGMEEGGQDHDPVP